MKFRPYIIYFIPFDEGLSHFWILDAKNLFSLQHFEKRIIWQINKVLSKNNIYENNRNRKCFAGFSCNKRYDSRNFRYQR
jgi:hypothetical protein